MTRTRPSFILMSAFVLAATALFVAAASPMLQVAASVAL